MSALSAFGTSFFLFSWGSAQFFRVKKQTETETALARIQNLQTGGNSFCYWMLYHFDMNANIAQQFVVIRKGDFPLYDVRLRIVDMDSKKQLLERPWGEVNAPADFQLLKWSLKPEQYYRIHFHARNGSWNQDLILKRSDKAKCWLAATRVLGGKGDVLFEHRDNEFAAECGDPKWRA